MAKKAIPMKQYEVTTVELIKLPNRSKQDKVEHYYTVSAKTSAGAKTAVRLSGGKGKITSARLI